MDLGSRLSALRKIWVFCAIACAVGLIASLGIQSFSLDAPLAVSEEDCKDVEGQVIV